MVLVRQIPTKTSRRGLGWDIRHTKPFRSQVSRCTIDQAHRPQRSPSVAPSSSSSPAQQPIPTIWCTKRIKRRARVPHIFVDKVLKNYPSSSSQANPITIPTGTRNRNRGPEQPGDATKRCWLKNPLNSSNKRLPPGAARLDRDVAESVFKSAICNASAMRAKLPGRKVEAADAKPANLPEVSSTDTQRNSSCQQPSTPTSLR